MYTYKKTTKITDATWVNAMAINNLKTGEWTHRYGTDKTIQKPSSNKIIQQPPFIIKPTRLHSNHRLPRPLPFHTLYNITDLYIYNYFLVAANKTR
ncbi:hypothetical protein Hanom_Chr02g00151551 [Helianthus anomalus]